MPSQIGYSLPPVSQRPQQYQRVEIEDLQRPDALQEDQALKEAGSDQLKTRVVTRTREVLDDRFPSESGVDRFRGNTEGRVMESSAAGGSISELPSRVQAFSPLTARSGDASSFTSAESAAIGLTSPTSEIQLSGSESSAQRDESKPVINGSGEIKARFDEIKERFEPSLDDADVSQGSRPGAPDSFAERAERIADERALARDLSRDQRDDQIESSQRSDLRLTDDLNAARRQEARRVEDRVIERQSEGRGLERAVIESANDERVVDERVARGEAAASSSDRPASNADAPRPRDPGEPVNAQGEPLSSEEQREVERLARRDREVRTHEQAHAAAGGAHIRGGVQLSYETGPDGQRYAVDGEVNIDLSDAGSPDQTVVKMRQVRAAALAPANPSGADRAVAALATRREMDAQAQAAIEDRQARTEQSEASRVEEKQTEETARAGSTEQRESADHIAGAQSVIPNPSFGPRTTGVEQQSLDYAYQSGYALSAPAETSRPVGEAPIAPDLKQSPKEQSSPRIEGDKPRQSEVAALAVERGW